jgi:hypothetical protein
MTIFRLTAEAVCEPCPIDDVFCPVAARIERVGPCHRLIFASPGLVYDDAGSDRRDLSVVAKLVLTDDALHALLQAIPQYLHMRPAVVPISAEVRVN